MTKIYNDILNEIKKAQSIALFMHINPDGDCIGSTLAMYLYLSKMGKRVHCFSADAAKPVPTKLCFLPSIDAFNAGKDEKYDLGIGLDVGDAGRIGDELFKVFVKCQAKIVIDHHSEYSDFANIVLREADSASTSQIIYKLMAVNDESIIDKDIATLLYVGLVTDSGGFTFASTSAETMYVGSKLLEKGVDNADICRRVMKDIDINVYRLKNLVFSRTKFYENNQIGIIVFRQEDFIETQTTESDTDGLINGVLNVTQVELVVSISEIGDKKYKISFRSKHDKVSAAACAKCFGGGGHFNAAGCRAYGYFEDVYNKILEVTKEMLSYA